jgi:hypothetical protein
MTRVKFLTPVILLLALCPLLAIGQPTLQGALTGTLGPGTYNVIGNCTVENGATLTIQPGTVFQYTGHYGLKVYGTLHANGTAADSITFKRQQLTYECEWTGLRFMTGATTNCNLTHCYIEGAKYQLFPDINGGGVYIHNGGVTLSYCTLANNYSASGGGMYIDGSPAVIDHCIFFNNAAGNAGGIYVYNSQNVTVNNSIFGKNSSSST